MQGLDELYMGCHGTLVLKMSERELDGTIWKQFTKFD